MYGLNSKEELRFQPVVGQDIYYADDEELSLDDLINTPLPPVPLDVTFTGHWLAIEGVQPAIPQNPSPQESIFLYIYFYFQKKKKKREIINYFFILF